MYDKDDIYNEVEAICVWCGKVFTTTEDQDPICPYCNGQAALAVNCKCCGAPSLDVDLTNGICEECVYENAKDVEYIHYLSDKEGWTDPVEINSIFAFLFSSDEINEILLKELRSSGRTFDCTEFIRNLEYEFSEATEKERREGYEGWKEYSSRSL